MTHLIKKPMLAETLEVESDAALEALQYPVLATPKIDGIRCLMRDSVAFSRKLIEIPNKHIQKIMSVLPNGLDGELIAGSNFSKVQSSVMSEDGEPDFRYCVFDYVTDSLTEPYVNRMRMLHSLQLPDFCVKLLPAIIESKGDLLAYESKCLAEGHEGIMIRSPLSPYKCGRSTVKEGFLLKVKRFLDSECVVIDFEEQLTNTNELKKDELGHAKRSSHKANLIPAGTLGKFLVREVGETAWKGKEFAIGTGEGLTHELRKEIWDNRDKYLGKTITYKYQPHGVKDLPRLPIFKGFRDSKDMG